MTPIDLHRKSYKRHREAILGRKIKGDLIESAEDYFNVFYNSDESISKTKLNKLRFLGVYHWYPMKDQQLAIIGTNPKFDPNIDKSEDGIFNFNGDEPTDGVLENVKRQSESSIQPWFRKNSASILGLTKWDEPTETFGILEGITNHTSLLEENTFEENGAKYFRRSFFEDIYYTNLFKFGSAEIDDIPECAIQEVQHIIDKELEIINPELVLLLGQSWNLLTESDDQITQTHGKMKTYNGYDVIPLVHPSMYSLNTEKEQNERYRLSLKSWSPSR